MHYCQLGQTDLKVSKICLGTMTWGEQNSQAEAFSQLDLAMEHRVNFIDTAELYPVPPKAETQGETETILGNWLKRSGKREDLIIASKVAGKSDWLPYLRDGQARFDRKNIETALHASLRRLNTSYIDLYQLHWPDRQTNFFGPLDYSHNPADTDWPALESVLEVLHDFVQQGKIRHIGVSNETPWGLMRYLALAEMHGWPRMVSIQNPYSLLNRSFETGLAEVAIRENAGLLAYSPLGFGVLSGKYLQQQQPAGARLTLFDRFTRYTSPRGIAATEAYVNVARKYQLDPAQMALAWVNSRPFVTSNIVGATNLTQLSANLESIQLKLDTQVLDAIENIHQNNPNPCP